MQEGAYFAIDMVADFTEHIGEVWRVQWNVTGTILSSSGDDGKVHLWGKASYLDEWSLLSTVSSEQGGSQMIQ